MDSARAGGGPRDDGRSREPRRRHLRRPVAASRRPGGAPPGRGVLDRGPARVRDRLLARGGGERLRPRGRAPGVCDPRLLRARRAGGREPRGERPHPGPASPRGLGRARWARPTDAGSPRRSSSSSRCSAWAPGTRDGSSLRSCARSSAGRRRPRSVPRFRRSIRVEAALGLVALALAGVLGVTAPPAPSPTSTDRPASAPFPSRASARRGPRPARDRTPPARPEHDPPDRDRSLGASPRGCDRRHGPGDPRGRERGRGHVSARPRGARGVRRPGRRARPRRALERARRRPAVGRVRRERPVRAGRVRRQPRLTPTGSRAGRSAAPWPFDRVTGWAALVTIAIALPLFLRSRRRLQAARHLLADTQKPPAVVPAPR